MLPILFHVWLCIPAGAFMPAADGNHNSYNYQRHCTDKYYNDAVFLDEMILESRLLLLK
jgi:hypothetical protein